MVQKSIIIIATIVILFLIGIDLYKIEKANSRIQNKLKYLETLNQDDELQTYYSTIRKNFTKISLWTNYNNFIELNPSNVSDHNVANWKKYISSLDIEAFSKELDLIPQLSNSANSQVIKIRNKMILKLILEYALLKVSNYNETICWGGFRVDCDIFNNITLIDNCSINYLHSINGVLINSKTQFPIILSKSDYLTIEYAFENTNKLLDENFTCNTTTIDLRNLYH